MPLKCSDSCLCTYARSSEWRVKAKLREYLGVLKGEKFSTLAVLYSEDKGSAVKGGEIGFVGRAEVEPEFSACIRIKACQSFAN